MQKLCAYNFDSPSKRLLVLRLYIFKTSIRITYRLAYSIGVTDNEGEGKEVVTEVIKRENPWK